MNIFYYVIVMSFTMLFWHPFVLAATFVSALLYNVIIDGKDALKFVFRVILPLYILIILINPLVNHRGATILFYLNNNMITKESMVFGMLSGLMVTDMLMIFYSFNRVMTSDKLLSVFEVFSSSFALVFTMTLRLIPRYRRELEKIGTAQKNINEGISDGGFFDRIRHGFEMLNAVITFALEDGIDTANSMTARGYGLKGKSRFRKNRITRTDRLTIIVLLVLLAFISFAAFRGFFDAVVFPELDFAFSLSYVPFYAMYLTAAMMPVIIEVKEAFLWHMSKQKI